MQKVWLHTKVKARGFSTVEVLLAATIFGMIAMAIVGALVYGNQATADAGEHGRATMLAQEGLEAVRNIRDGQDATYINTTGAATYGLAQTGNQWALSGSSDVSGIFTRQVAITPIDTARKNITVTVSWPNGATTSQVTATGRLSNWLASIVPPVTSGPVMMVYSKTTNTPHYRIWDGTNWSAESSAMTVGGGINYIAVKSSATRNEAVLGTQDSTGAIYFQVWNGTTWGNRVQVGTGPTTTRSFDVAYENTTGRAMIAYSTGADFAYRIWDGIALSTATTVTAPPTTGAVNWMELRQNPLSGSNEIAMIMSDANADVYGMRWTGSVWNNMGTAAAWDTTASTAARKGIDVEYEQVSGRIMFMWGDATATDLRYRVWNGATLTAATLLDIPAMGGITNWVQLAARPSSNEIMMGVQDAASDLNTRKWSGTAWDTATQHPEHDGAVENLTTRNFDILWENHPANPGEAWLMWGGGANVQKKQWSGTTWGGVTTLAGSDDTSFIRLRADSNGSMFAGIYESAASAEDDIWESHITDGSANWSTRNVMWIGPTSAEPVYFRMDIATP